MCHLYVTDTVLCVSMSVGGLLFVFKSLPPALRVWGVGCTPALVVSKVRHRGRAVGDLCDSHRNGELHPQHAVQTNLHKPGVYQELS